LKAVETAIAPLLSSEAREEVNTEQATISLHTAPELVVETVRRWLGAQPDG
jgi:hypothetical protein